MAKCFDLLFFDTETTWFKDWRVVQMWMIQGSYSSDFKPLIKQKASLLFNPNKEIDKGAEWVHWIWQHWVNNKPNFSSFMRIFIINAQNASLIIWHNVEYDIRIIENEFNAYFGDKREIDIAELGKINIDEFFSNVKKKIFDTMKEEEIVKHCWLKGKQWLKWPKLTELHEKLFWEGFEWAHDALEDITATEKCFWELVKRQVINIK